MRVKICYTVDVDDQFRRALNSYFGKEGLASREDLKFHYYMNGGSIDDDIIGDYQRLLEHEAAEKTDAGKQLESVPKTENPTYVTITCPFCEKLISGKLMPENAGFGLGEQMNIICPHCSIQISK